MVEAKEMFIFQIMESLKIKTMETII